MTAFGRNLHNRIMRGVRFCANRIAIADTDGPLSAKEAVGLGRLYGGAYSAAAKREECPAAAVGTRIRDHYLGLKLEDLADTPARLALLAPPRFGGARGQATIICHVR
jgi:hypothetical protein